MSVTADFDAPTAVERELVLGWQDCTGTLPPPSDHFPLVN